MSDKRDEDYHIHYVPVYNPVRPPDPEKLAKFQEALKDWEPLPDD